MSKQETPQETPLEKPPLIQPGYLLPFAMVTLLFFLWAFPNILNDVLIKQFEKSLELSSMQSSFLPLALKTGYFFLAIPAGLFMQRKGYKNGILFGLGLFALGCLLFYPAAHSRQYIVFLGGIFVMAGGCAFLEIGANSFVVALGDKRSSERRLNLAQSFNPIGGIAASALGMVFIFSGIEPKDHTVALWKEKPAIEVYQFVQTAGAAGSDKFFTQDFLKNTTKVGGKSLPVVPAAAEDLEKWKKGQTEAWKFFSEKRSDKTLAAWQTSQVKAYDAFLEAENLRVFPTYLTLAALVLVIAFIIKRTKFPEIAAPAKDAAGGQKGSLRELLKFPHWRGAIVSQFFYLGAQLGTWSYLIIYIQNNAPVGEKIAAQFLIANMVIFMVGRFLSTYLMKFVKPQKLMGIYALVNIALVAVAILGSKWAAVTLRLGLHGVVLPLPVAPDMPNPVGVFALMATTLFMSLMYPTNFASGMKGLGPNAKLGASILVMSLIGGALLSTVMGQIRGLDFAQLADMGVTYKGEVAPALIIPVISYCVIAWYAFVGSRPRGPLYE
jgi:FHS family L-fucose permease-like MFS transporter